MRYPIGYFFLLCHARRLPECEVMRNRLLITIHAYPLIFSCLTLTPHPVSRIPNQYLSHLQLLLHISLPLEVITHWNTLPSLIVDSTSSFSFKRNYIVFLVLSLNHSFDLLLFAVDVVFLCVVLLFTSINFLFRLTLL